MRITIDTGDGARELRARPGEKILRAALSEGIDLPYDCATGTCGSCKVRLVEGRTATDWAEAPGGRRCGAGEILSCQSVPLGDCKLSLPRLRAAEPGASRPAARRAVLRRTRRLNPEVIWFDVAAETPMDFAAGQFVLLESAGISGARAYSIASSRRDTTDLSFVARRKPGGRFTGWLFGAGDGAAEGAPLALFGPLGRATFQPAAEKPLLCIAGGSGVAGMLSMLGRAHDEGHLHRHGARLFFGVRTRRDLFLLDELAAWRTRHPERVEITVVLSEDEDPPGALAERYPGLLFRAGLVHEVAGRQMEGRFAGARAYVAGPRAMVDAAVRLLIQRGRLPAHDIRHDRFD